MKSVLRRPVLLLSAAASITVPGALAVLAVLGHQHEDSVPSAHSVPLGSQLSQAGEQALLPASGRSGTGPAPNIRAMIPASVLADENRARGLQLLSQAATAGRAASYQGVEAIVDTTVAGPNKAVATVWHSGGLTVLQLAGGKPEVSYDGDGRAPEGVFGVTTTLVRLLDKNYVPMYLGSSSVIGRPALVVAVQRADGSTAARFWLDQRTFLPLRRDVYDTSAHVVSDDQFTRVRFGAGKMPKVAGLGSAAWAAAPSPVQLLSKLNGEGSLLPQTLPGDLSLYAGSVASTSAGQVTDLGFSDGLSVVSLFVERGILPAKMPGWQPEQISGHMVYVAQHEVTMSGRGFVYTLITDAPPKTVDAVVGALPPTGSPGILGRLGRGLGRIVSVLDPFN
jgi:sigma-E factor negative regulatory protein RseB